MGEKVGRFEDLEVWKSFCGMDDLDGWMNSCGILDDLDESLWDGWLCWMVAFGKDVFALLMGWLPSARMDG